MHNQLKKNKKRQGIEKHRSIASRHGKFKANEKGEIERKDNYGKIKGQEKKVTFEMGRVYQIMIKTPGAIVQAISLPRIFIGFCALCHFGLFSRK